MKALIASVFTALCLVMAAAPPARAQQVSSGWLSGSDYQQFFDTRIRGQGLMPVSVEAGLFFGHVRYLGVFAQQQRGVGWVTHHGLSDRSFAERNQAYLQQGYRLGHHHRFDAEGQVRNQGVWYR